MYYNSLRVINTELSQHASGPRDMISHQLSPLKNNYENSKQHIF
jgi:hypothetical protein